MEHKIGEIITLPDGRKAEVAESVNNLCIGCYYHLLNTSDCISLRKNGKLGKCILRTDHKNIIYKEIKEE